MADTITYDIQQAGYDLDRYDEKGPATYETFLAAFKEFPWAEQVGRSNGGSEPTISVKNHSKKIYLWVSVIQHQSGYDYVLGIVYPKEKPSLLGLGKPTQVRWVEIFIAEEVETVESVFRAFFADDIDGTFRQLRALLFYDEAEARN